MVYKILIIDDEATIRRLLSVLLKRNGHEVLEAADGETGVETANNHQPDIILLDIMMPRVDGFETLRRLRANPNTAEIPVIFVSAKSQVEDRVEGLRLGADDYVVKPADPTELMMRIEAVMNRSRRQIRRRRAATHALVGVRGGVGTSTVIVNLGSFLQREASRRCWSICIWPSALSPTSWICCRPPIPRPIWQPSRRRPSTKKQCNAACSFTTPA
ncbi:MAG: response regulator [Caldilineaceae bacterium]